MHSISLRWFLIEWGGDDARKDGGGDGGPRWSVDPIWARAGWRREERMMTFGLGHLRISASISAPRGAKKSRLPEKGPLLETPGRVRLGRSAELLQNCRLVMRTWSATLLWSTCTVIFCMLQKRVANCRELRKRGSRIRCDCCRVQERRAGAR
jgi:hypothetical protein